MTACHCASQLGLICLLRDEEMLPQRFGAEAAIFVHEPSPQDGGAHGPLQFEAKVRSQLIAQSQTANCYTNNTSQLSVYVNIFSVIVFTLFL